MMDFLKKAFSDMKQSAKEQHQVDTAQFEAVKAESRAQWEEAKMTPAQQAEKRCAEQQKTIQEAKARTAAANERMEKAHQ